MVRLKKQEGGREKVARLLELMDVEESYFDTSRVGRLEDVVPYRVDNRYISTDILESEEDLSRRVELMDHSRQDFSGWTIGYGQPYLPVDDRVKLSLRKEYDEALKGTTLSQEELEAGVFKIEGHLDPEQVSMERLETLLE